MANEEYSLGGCIIFRPISYILQTRITPPPSEADRQWMRAGAYDKQIWKLQATRIESRCWTLEIGKIKRQLFLTNYEQQAPLQRRGILVSHKYESVIAYFDANGRGTTNNLPLLPGSGRVFGQTYQLDELKRLLTQNNVISQDVISPR
jgi:hypothetical protein